MPGIQLSSLSRVIVAYVVGFGQCALESLRNATAGEFGAQPK
jgi:hypothetical protein